MLDKDKNYIALFLLALICLPTAVFLSLRISKLIVRHEMLERLEHSNLEEITLAKKDVFWYEEGKEIIIGGSLFDVKSSIVKNDSVVFKGLFDQKESELRKNIDLLTDYQNKSSSSNTLIIAQLVLHLWDDTSYRFALVYPTMVLTALKNRQVKHALLFPPRTPPSPPPRMS